jgi:hypothetical protein
MTKQEREDIAQKIADLYDERNCFDPQTVASGLKDLIKLLLGIDKNLINVIEEYNPDFQEIFDSVDFL